LWFLWHCLWEFLRSEDPSCKRFGLWGNEDLLRVGDSACFLSEVWQGEAGETTMVSRQSILHETFCLFCGAAVPVDDDSGRSTRVEAALGYGEGFGKAVYEGAASESRGAHCEGYWYRRDFAEEGSYLSDCSKRPDPATSNLVWRKRSFRSKHGSFLSVAGSQEGETDKASGDGHVEGIPKVGKAAYSSSRYSFRQVSCFEAFGRGARYRKKAGISEAFREGSEIYQGTEIHPLIPQREFIPGRSSQPEAFTGCQQKAEYSLCTQGILWAALGLPDRGVGKEVLRELEGFSQMAKTKALRKVRQNDRATLGWNCSLLPSGKQSSFRIRRGFEQQDSSDSTKSLWSQRRRISSTQNTNLYVEGDLKLLKFTHSIA